MKLGLKISLIRLAPVGSKYATIVHIMIAALLKVHVICSIVQSLLVH